MTAAGARAFVAGCLIEALMPRERLDLPDWMERHVILRREESLDSPGAYRRDRSIPMGKLFAKFNREKEWRVLIVKKGSQSAFTLHCLGDMAMHVAEDPQNMMFVIDSEKEARKISRKRLGPMLEDCGATSGVWVENEDDQNTLEYSFPGMSLWLVGAGSAGALASKSCGRMYADEVDKHQDLKGEASSLDLLQQRGKEVEGSVMIAGSTPTDEEGPITKAHATGSQEVMMVPCPHCGGRQALDMPNPERSPRPLRFEHCARGKGVYDLRRVLEETWYECEHCQGKIVDADKPGMLAAGDWESTNFEEIDGDLVPAWEPGVMSAQLNDLYSVHANSRFGQIAVEWIKARDDPGKMHNFLNGRLGRELKATVFEVRPEGVRRLCSGYLRGSMPEVPAILTIQADNQGAEVVKWVVMGWLPSGDAYVVDWGVADSREQMDEIEKRTYECGGRQLVAQRGIMDEGGEEGTTWEVRQFCAGRMPFWLPSKGRAGRQIDHITRFRNCAIAKGGEWTIPVLHFDDDAFKRQLYLQKIARFDPVKVEENGLSRLHLPQNVTEQFCRELSGENLKRVPGKGVVWVPSPPNDFGDAVKMGYVLWNVIGPEFMRV